MKPELFLQLRRAELEMWWLALQSCPLWIKLHADLLDSMGTSHPKALHFSVYVNKGLSFIVSITNTWIFFCEPFVFSVASCEPHWTFPVGTISDVDPWSSCSWSWCPFFHYYPFTSKLPICRAGVSLPVTSCFCPWKGVLGHFRRGRRGLRGSAWVTGGSQCFLWLGTDSHLIPGGAENYVYDLLTSSWDCGFGKWVHRWQRWDGSRCCWSDEWNQLTFQ